MSALDVLPLVDAKRYLNIPLARAEDDAELAGFVPAAVQRVERHLWGESSTQQLEDLDVVSPLQLLAVKVVLGEFWRTQRLRTARAGSGASGTAIDADSGPAGLASLRTRLTELLGPPADGKGSDPAEPVGSFPPALPWPDPVVPVSARWW